ncbi:glycosyltransferase family 2 protein [Candidatus Woesearchaeota archaeon]|nr:glycosyltransferase family 2 protein [Candidatus Woesearchaeota archaeon]
MIEIAVWFVSFLSLFLGIFWIRVLYAEVEEKKGPWKPKVSIIVPAYNEEMVIKETLQALQNTGYPQDKLEIIAVNDGSTDKTKEIIEECIKEGARIKLLNREKNGGTKAAALNMGVNNATGEIIGCVDADSTVTFGSIDNMLTYFEDEKVAAVISAIKVDETKNIYEKVQRLEYIISTFSRKLMAKINTLHNTPGALSLYRAHRLREIGGFDENNLTEDLEVALHLIAKGHKIKIAPECITFTKVPNSFRTLWNQRVRWFRGFIYNTVKYKQFLFNKKHGMVGMFQYPVNVLTIIVTITMAMLIGIELIEKIHTTSVKVGVLGVNIIRLIDIPSLKEVFLGLNIKIMFPIAITILLSLYMYNEAHKLVNEKWTNLGILVIYMTVYPIVRTLHWITAVTKEARRSKNKW